MFYLQSVTLIEVMKNLIKYILVIVTISIATCYVYFEFFKDWEELKWMSPRGVRFALFVSMGVTSYYAYHLKKEKFKDK